jgi:maleamate amidohydrolase
MSEPIWNKYLTEEDKAIFAAAGWQSQMGFGERPALLVIDVSYGFAGEKDLPILESMKKWRLSCGPESWVAIDHMKQLIDKAHEKELPVIYTTGFSREDNWDAGGWAWKNANNREWKPAPASNKGHNTIVDEIAPAPQDIVIYKQKPSAFFGTNLTSYLTLLGCDSVIITGTVTSGCVRATVIDAFSLNYRIAIAGEACFDRIPVSHAVNLLDMNAKYGDVRPTSEIIDYFDGLPDDLFKLPKGSKPDAVAPDLKVVASR